MCRHGALHCRVEAYNFSSLGLGTIDRDESTTTAITEPVYLSADSSMVTDDNVADQLLRWRH